VIKKIFFALTGVVLCALCALPARAEVVDQIVAIVNDEIVTFSELKKVLNPIYAQYEKTYEGDELVEKMVKARNEVLEQLINNKLLMQQARKKDVKVDPKEIDERIAQIKSRFPTEEDFTKALGMDGMTVDNLRKNIEEQLLIRGLVQMDLAHKAMISPREVEEYYKEHAADFSEGETINVCNIMIKHKKRAENEPDKAWDVISNIRKEVKNGADFEVLAKRYSEGPNAAQGGDMGFFSRGSMMKDIEDVAFNMKAGEVSEIIKTDTGYYLLYLKARRSPRLIPIQDVSKDIERELFQRKIEELKGDYVREIRKKAFVKIME